MDKGAIIRLGKFALALSLVGLVFFVISGSIMCICFSSYYGPVIACGLAIAIFIFTFFRVYLANKRIIDLKERQSSFSKIFISSMVLYAILFVAILLIGENLDFLDPGPRF
jgi:small-conductance mechanosensitive channel